MSGKSRSLQYARDRKVIGLLGYVRVFKRFAEEGQLVDVREEVLRLTRRQELTANDLTVPWERRTEPFKAYWVTLGISQSGFRPYGLTVRLGEDGIARYSGSPHGLSRSFYRRLGAMLDPSTNPFWIALEEKVAVGSPTPHFHGVLGIPRSSDHDAVDDLKERLYPLSGGFYKPKAIDLRRLYLNPGWAFYCGKNAAATKASTGHKAFHFPRPIMRAGREHYEAFQNLIATS